MKWNKKAELVYNVTKLGRREAQVLVLQDEGHSSESITNQILEYEDSAPQSDTIRSIQSKLKRRKIQTTFLHNIFNSSTDSIQSQHLLKQDFRQPLTIHAYIGQIGSGKTVTANQHALRLDNESDIESIQAIDVLDSMNLDCIDQYNISDVTESVKNKFIETVESCIEEYKENKNYVLFIDQAHYILNDSDCTNRVINLLKESSANISLRLISQSVSDFDYISDSLDFVTLFRTTETKDILYGTDLPVSPTNLHIGTDEEPWTELIQLNLNEDTKRVAVTFLTDDQKQKIN